MSEVNCPLCGGTETVTVTPAYEHEFTYGVTDPVTLKATHTDCNCSRCGFGWWDNDAVNAREAAVREHLEGKR